MSCRVLLLLLIAVAVRGAGAEEPVPYHSMREMKFHTQARIRCINQDKCALAQDVREITCSADSWKWQCEVSEPRDISIAGDFVMHCESMTQDSGKKYLPTLVWRDTCTLEVDGFFRRPDPVPFDLRTVLLQWAWFGTILAAVRSLVVFVEWAF